MCDTENSKIYIELYEAIDEKKNYDPLIVERAIDMIVNMFISTVRKYGDPTEMNQYVSEANKNFDIVNVSFCHKELYEWVFNDFWYMNIDNKIYIPKTNNTFIFIWECDDYQNLAVAISQNHNVRKRILKNLSEKLEKRDKIYTHLKTIIIDDIAFPDIDLDEMEYKNIILRNFYNWLTECDDKYFTFEEGHFVW